MKLLQLSPLLLLTITAAAALAQEDAPEVTFRSETRLVNTPFRVLDPRGEPVRDLKASDIEVLDDGKPQTPQSFDNGSGALSVVMMVDTSSSMGESDFLTIAKGAATQFSQMRLEREHSDRLALVTIGDHPTALRLSPSEQGTEALFSSDPATLRDAIDSLQTSGETAIRDALAASSLQLLKDQQGKSAIVVLTDGQDNVSAVSAAGVQRALGEASTIVFPIIVNPTRYGLKTMQPFADSTGGELFQVSDRSEISAIYAKVADKLNHVYAVGYAMPAGALNHRHILKIRVRNHPELRVLNRESYCPSEPCQEDPKTPEETAVLLQQALAAHPEFAVDRSQESTLFPFTKLPNIAAAPATTPASALTAAPATGAPASTLTATPMTAAVVPAPTAPPKLGDVPGCVCLDGRSFRVGDELALPDTRNWRGRIDRLTAVADGASARCVAHIANRELDDTGLGYYTFRLRTKPGARPDTADICTAGFDSPDAPSQSSCHKSDIVFNANATPLPSSNGHKAQPLPALTVGAVQGIAADGACQVEFYRIAERGFFSRMLGHKRADWLKRLPTPDDPIMKEELTLPESALVPGLRLLDSR